MHDLGPKELLANKYTAFEVPYVVNNNPRRVGILVLVVEIARIVYGANA
jgi:hypothetical protein